MKRQVHDTKKGAEMNVGKMQGVRIVVEPKCETEDSENRVYVSLVWLEEEPIWTRSWDKVPWKIKGVLKVLFKSFVSFAVSAATAVLIFHLTFLERGYEAIGLEYLLVIIVFLAAYWLMGKAVGYYHDYEIQY